MASKLGFHIQRRRRGWPNVVADTVPALVKSLEWRIVDEWIPVEQSDLTKIQRALKWTEFKVFLLGRHLMTYQSLDKPADRAYEFWNHMLGELTGGDRSRDREVQARMRLFDAWEGYNEIGTGAEIDKLARFDAILARYFHDEGIKYACGGFAVGKPSLDEWPRYCEALMDEASSGRGARPDFLHVHEYWYPGGDWEELLDTDGSVNAERMREATRGRMLHWRELYEQEGTPNEMRLPVIISECGWDQAWPEQVGFRRSLHSDEDYAKWLIWYDRELQKPLNGVDYVVGAAIYTYGHESRWASFEIDQWQGRGVLDMLRTHLRECNQSPHRWDWRAAWDEDEGEGEGVPEESHYVLMEPDISIRWRNALGAYLATFKVTNGQSLEDALRLGAREHHITLVGHKGEEPGVLGAWEEEIRRRNPNVVIDRMEAASTRELRRIASLRAVRGDRYGERDGE